MKRKFTFLIAAAVMLLTMMARPVTVWGQKTSVTLAYSGTTTTNMTGNNDAELVGLSATDWSVIGAKGGNTNFPGLNKAGDIRLYYHANGSNTITVTALNSNYTITNIQVTYTSTDYNNGKVLVGGNEVTGTAGTYAINSTSFVITNGNNSNVQVRISSILINYSTGGGSNPEITIPASELSLSYEENDHGSFNVTYTDFTVALATATLYLDAACTQAFPTTGSDAWIVLDDMTDPYTSISYIVDQNDGTERTAYMKVEALDNDSNDLDEVFTITQATQPTYTVTYNANGGTGTMTDSNSPYHAGDNVTLLANSFTAPDGKVWDSWLVKDANNTAITVDEGHFTMPASNVTVTAQWIDDPSAPTYEWVLTPLTSLTAEDIFVIVGDNGNTYAMSNNNGTGTAPSAVEVTISTDDKITSTVTDNIKWKISGNGTDGYTFYPNGSTTTWLYCTASNNGVRVGTNNNKLFVINLNYLYNSATERHVGIYNSQDWRCYSPASGTQVHNNIAGQTFAFYKRQVATNNPTIGASNVDIACDATNGHIDYTINNEPTPAGTLTASIVDGGTIANLTLGTIASGAVSFTCDANPTGTARTATVTLTYTYNTDQTVTKNVTITQAGDPNIADNISDITGADDYHVKGMVVATNSRGFIIGDGTGYVYTYLNAAPTWNVGDNLSITGTTSTSYGHVIQFTSAANVETTSSTNYNGDPQPLAITEVPDYSTGNHLSTYLQFEGTLTKETSGSYTNYNIAVGGSTIRVSYPTDDQITALDALLTKTVRVHGFFAGISGTTFTALMESVEEVVVPTLAVTPETVSVPYTGGSGNFTVTPSNVSSAFGGYVTFYDPANPENELDPEPTWIFISHDYSDFSLSYSITDVNNTTEPRTACFKFVVMCNEGLAKSNLITVTQAANIPTFDVTFDVDGGTFVANTDFPTVSEQKEAGTYNLPSATKAGTNFAGWLLDGTTDIYAAGASFNVTADVSFTAQWSNALTGTIHFCSTAGTGNMNINASPKEGTDDLGNTWTVTTEGTTSFTPSNQYCQIGASSKPATSITFTTTLPADATITAFEAKFGGFSGTAGDVSLTVGTTEVATGSLNATTDVIVGGPVAAYGKVLTVTVTNIAKGVKAYYISYSYEMSTDPIINAPATVELPYDATSGQINYTIANPVAGKSLGAATTASWISNIVVTDEKVSFTTTVNDGTDDRVATFTLTYEGAADKTVTVTQAHLVVDYATLPFNYMDADVLKDGLSKLPTGLTQDGLGTYTSTNATQRLKFDSNDDWLLLKVNEALTSLSYDIKGNGFSGGTFKVQISNDGVTYTDMDTYTTLESSALTVTHIDLPTTVRYIKWIYVNKSSGNVALGNIHASTDYDIYGNVTVDHLNIPIGKVCTIYSGATLNIGINGLSNEGNATNLIIKDGGQLYTPSAVRGTVEKNITGYGNSTGKDGYYLVSAPAKTMISPIDHTDAYHFDAYYQGEEWRNIRQALGPWHISAESAALYASQENRTLSFNGYSYNGTTVINNDLPATNAPISVSVSFNSGKTFEGWNLIGNPFTCKAYLSDKRDFYRMNDDRDGFILNTDANGGGNAINVCEGIFVETTTGETSVTFTTEPPVTSTGNNHGMINISLNQTVNRGEQSLVDNARIRFGEGNAMHKFSFNDNTAKVYFTEGNQDYAVVRSEAQGEMPVNFKAANDGTYTLDFSMDNVEFDYLHLIDNKTGMDIDLLQTPSYTFEATTHDYAARFRLVFSANSVNENSSESFAFISNGQLILTNVDNNTTVQMIDALGRMIVSTNAMNHVSTDNMAPGVYVLRLVNGNDVKTQKIVVK